ncbi:MAG: exonuclease SbcC [Verrucomicrobiales bacterium]|jgi:exonuclease SbcC
MRILRIGLKNLNSLRGEHTVDLENGPLADAGIFAITGPTGAGKSTLLDAITLALYGRAARYGKKPNPEDMMSRHTGVCSAEVVFEVREGRFRAEWQLNRARKDPNGKLQPAKRFLYDGDGLPLTQRMREVDDALAKLIGLDYERFLRSAMLAQGDFARFLKANANERSELLESLTGTQVYSHLSALCHEETARQEESLRVKDQALGEIQLLEPDACETLKQEMRKLKVALHEDKKAADVLRAEVERGRQLSQCLEKQQSLRELGVALELEERRQAAHFGELKLHRKAERFLPGLAKIEQREQTLAQVAEAATAAGVVVKEERKDLRAVLEVARRQAEQSANSADNEAKKLTAAMVKLAGENAALVRWLAAHKGDAQLVTALPTIAAGLTKREGQARQSNELEKRHGEFVDERDKVTTERDTLQVELRRVEAKGMTLRDAFTACQEQQMKTLGGRKLEQMQEQFEQMRKQQEAADRSQKLREKGDGLTARVEQLQPEVGRLRELLLARKDVMEALRDALESARLVASLDEHRQDLKPGEHCPLCGAKEHPFSDPEKRPIERAEKLQQAREEVAELEKLLRNSEAELTRINEGLRAAREEQFELGKVLVNAPKNVREQLQEVKAQIALVQEVEQEMMVAEKALLECQGEFGRVKEQVASREQRMEKLRADHERISAELTTARSELALQNEALTQVLSPFTVVLPSSGGEGELRQQLEQRALAFRDQQQGQLDATTRTTEAKAKVEKFEEAAKLSREEADAFFRTVREEGLGEVPIASGLPSIDGVATVVNKARAARSAAEATVRERKQAKVRAEAALSDDSAVLLQQLETSEFADLDSLRHALLAEDAANTIEAAEKELQKRRAGLGGQQKQVDDTLQELRAAMAPQGELLDTKESEVKSLIDRIDTATARLATVKAELERDEYNRKMVADRAKSMRDERSRLGVWQRMRELIGSHDGRKFRTFAQGLSLDLLLRHANGHLCKLTDRYQLRRVEGGALQLEIIDLHQANVARPMESLSGGESFLASLALALGLSDLAGRNVRIDSLFIDEGFGSLDHDTLDVAVAALEGLRSGSKTVGVISHVDLLKERIGAQLRVQPGPGGISVIDAVAG